MFVESCLNSILMVLNGIYIMVFYGIFIVICVILPPQSLPPCALAPLLAGAGADNKSAEEGGASKRWLKIAGPVRKSTSNKIEQKIIICLVGIY